MYICLTSMLYSKWITHTQMANTLNMVLSNQDTANVLGINSVIMFYLRLSVAM
jgi:hypothetical protein